MESVEMTDTDEFDQDFFELNPGLVKAQKYFEANKDQLLKQMQIEPGKNLDISDKLNVNLYCNNQRYQKNFGLNQNKRGKFSKLDIALV